MKLYAYILLVFLILTVFAVSSENYRVSNLPSLVKKIDAKIKAEVYEQFNEVREVLRPRYYNSLSWVDFEGYFYLDKDAIEQILARNFYAKKSIMKPGTYYVTVTGYSSTPMQCGPNPFITASGQKVRDGIVAANFLPFGTKLKIPEVFGDKIFVVQDRMAQRHWNRVDIWFPNYSHAASFGVRKLKIEVLS